MELVPKRTLEEPRLRAREPVVQFLVRCAVGVLLAVTVAMASGSPRPHNVEGIIEATRWDSVACALDHVGVPFAWGITSGLRHANGLIAIATEPPSGSFAWLSHLSSWARVVLSDGLFIPVQECAPLWEAPPSRYPTDGAHLAHRLEECVVCARGISFCVLHHLDRFRLAMLIDESVAAISALASSAAAGIQHAAWRRLGMHALKLLLACELAEGPAYFLGTQVELAWALIGIGTQIERPWTLLGTQA